MQNVGLEELTMSLTSENIIHIRVIQRNGKKCTTVVEGLSNIDPDPKFLETISKHFRKTFNCSTVVKKPDNVIQCTGDHRDKIKDFLVGEKIVDAEHIKIYGH